MINAIIILFAAGGLVCLVLAFLMIRVGLEELTEKDTVGAVLSFLIALGIAFGGIAMWIITGDLITRA